MTVWPFDEENQVRFLALVLQDQFNVSKVNAWPLPANVCDKNWLNGSNENRVTYQDDGGATLRLSPPRKTERMGEKGSRRRERKDQREKGWQRWVSGTFYIELTVQGAKKWQTRLPSFPRCSSFSLSLAPWLSRWSLSPLSKEVLSNELHENSI